MQTIRPKCIQGKDCVTLCTYQQCDKPAFICEHDCGCQQNHHQCESDQTWKRFYANVLNKIMTPNAETKLCLQEINQLYLKMLNQIQKNYEKFQNEAWKIELTEDQVRVLSKIKDNHIDSVTGSQIATLIASMKNTSAFNININSGINKFEQLNKQLKHWNSLKLSQQVAKKVNYKSFASHIEFDEEILINFFKPRRLKKVELLYRATENGFSISKFHQKCDNKGPTVVLIRTEFDRIIGGFTPFDWSSINPNYKYDNVKKQSFIFSISHNEKLILGANNNIYQIYCTSDHGPNFGGSDIRIEDKANISNKSYCNVCYTYNHNSYVFGSQQTYTRFTGQPNGKNFKIKEWEVFSIDLIN